MDEIELQELEQDSPDHTPSRDVPEGTSPTREPKRRRLDVASLLNPQTDIPGEPTPSNSPQPARVVETDNDILQGPPILLHHPQPPTPSTSRPTKLFPLVDLAMPKGKKRKAENTVTTAPANRSTQGEAVGSSRSAQVARTRNEQVANGTFVVNNTFLLPFKRKIRLIDPGADFVVGGNVKAVTHSVCGQTVKMKEPYNTAHFIRHTGTCSGPPKVTRGRKNTFVPPPPNGGISRFFVPAKRAIAVPLQSLPCPGLTEAQHARIPIYLRRSSASGGGATSRTIITQQLYNGCIYKHLTKVQKANVRRTQALRFRWINDHHEERVVSAKCLGTVATKAGIEEAEPCTECTALLRLRVLRNVLRRPVPDDKNLKYIPKECIGTILGKLYVAHLGLREIMEAPVRPLTEHDCGMLNLLDPG